MEVNLESIVDNALETAAKIGAYQSEIFGARGKLLVLMVEKSIPSAMTNYVGGLAVRVATEKNIGFAYTTSFSPEMIQETIKSALENAKAKGEDKYFKGLPPETPTTDITPTYDKSTAELSLDDVIDFYEAVKNTIEEKKKKIALIGGGVIAGEVEVVLKNSLGAGKQGKATLVSTFLYSLATDEIPPAIIDTYEARNSIKEIDPNKLGEKLAEETLKAKRAKEINYSGKVPVIILPTALSSFLWVFSEEIIAPNVDRGSTPFKREKLGEKVASEEVSIIDNPRAQDCPWRTSRDDEGVPTKEVEIIRDGVLTSHLTDYYYATKWGVEPTGSCRRVGRWSFGWDPLVPPGVSPWWIEIKSKNQDTLENIISDIKEGFVIKSVMGIHQSDFTSGKFAVPAFGWYIRNGEIAHPVHNLMLSGTIPELLRGIRAISKETERTEYGDLPAVLVENLDVVASKSPLLYRIGLKLFNILLRIGIVKHPLFS